MAAWWTTSATTSTDAWASSSNLVTWKQWATAASTATTTTTAASSITRIVNNARAPVQRPVDYFWMAAPEEAARHAEAQRQRRAEEEAVRIRSKAAMAKAEATLLRLLTPEQEQSWRENRAIFVTSQSGKRFTIKEGMTHNFHEVGADNQLIREFCAHIAYDAKCPVIDNVIAQLLALRFNEEMILKTANIWDVQGAGRHMIQEGRNG